MVDELITTPKRKFAGGLNTDVSDIEATFNEMLVASNARIRSEKISTAPYFSKYSTETLDGRVKFIWGDKLGGDTRLVVAAGTMIYSGSSGTFGAAIKTGLTDTDNIDMDMYLNRLFIGNGTDDNIKINSSMVVSNHGIVAPLTNPTVTEINPGAGAFPNAEVRGFYQTFWDNINKVESNPNDTVQTITIAAGPSDIRLSNTPTTTDTNVTHVRTYMSLDGGANYFRKSEDPILTDPIDITTNTEGTSEVEFDNNEPKKYDQVEYFDNALFVVYNSTKTYLNQSKAFRPEQFPLQFRYGIGDASDENIVLLKKFYGYLIIATRKSIWVLEKSLINGGIPRRITGYVGVINNKAYAILDNFFVFMGTDKRIYALDPTQFSKVDVRPKYVSDKIEPIVASLSDSAINKVCASFHHTGDRYDVLFSVPSGSNTTNNKVLVQDADSGGWTIDDKRISVFGNIRDDNDAIKLYHGDENGYVYVNDIGSGYGGSVIGSWTSSTPTSITDTTQTDVASTATSGGASTLTDTTQTWTVNEWGQEQVYIYSGTGAGQYATITSNTVDTLTISAPWGVQPDNTSVYHIGGYAENSLNGLDLEIIEGFGIDQKRIITSHDTITLNFSTAWVTTPDITSVFTVGGVDWNIQTAWDVHTASEDSTKRGWYNRISLVNTGNWDLEYSYARDANYNDTVDATITIAASGALWSTDLWGVGRWGNKNSSSQTVNFEAGSEYYERVQHRWRNRRPGQPFTINYLTTTYQDKGNLLAI